ncbi:hypothetical protein [Hahella sp. CCB-MM4]|uniref:hypothetical protein n=1 Tax=Hahella sp. (strain CCB-MM4) TaxID=1926491 RepID=UPI0011408D77|nr:hypothetical protein [Hahella sp. CCB-MM4]
MKDSLISENKKPLVFPAAVGILMVPSNNTSMVPDSTLRLAAGTLKAELLKNSDYVNRVIVVNRSDIYEKHSLEEIRQLYGVDILTVITYQQDQRSDRNGFSALMDFAIIPAFTVPSVKTTTTSVIEGTIVHLPSNAVIFRASGLDSRSRYMTPVATQENGRNEESIESLVSSVKDFGTEVSGVLDGLKEFNLSNAISMNDVIGESPDSTNLAAADDNGHKKDQWEAVNNYKKSGGGSGSPFEVILLTALVIFLKWTARAKY